MNEDYDIPLGLDDRTERLISRSLDGELTADEFAELESILQTDPSARQLLSEYRRVDQLAVGALKRDLESAKTVVAAQRFRGLRLAAAGAVLAAAAVVALSFLPDLWSAGPGANPALNRRAAVQPAIGLQAPGGPQQFVDYRVDDYFPRERQRDVVRDLIGVRGKNKKNQDVIYIFERNTQSTKITPISGDF